MRPNRTIVLKRDDVVTLQAAARTRRPVQMVVRVLAAGATEVRLQEYVHGRAFRARRDGNELTLPGGHVFVVLGHGERVSAGAIEVGR